LVSQVFPEITRGEFRARLGVRVRVSWGEVEEVVRVIASPLRFVRNRE
jgi:hypothetical protein